jgi:hypothetical protein
VGIGAPKGNRNALRHGRACKAVLTGRKVAVAKLKVAACVGLTLDMFFPAPKSRELRIDQRMLLAIHAPEWLSFHDHVVDHALNERAMLLSTDPSSQRVKVS